MIHWYLFKYYQRIIILRLFRELTMDIELAQRKGECYRRKEELENEIKIL